MGVVFKAEHLVTGRLCAVKLLHADWLGSEELKQRLLLEARAAARTRHPNIVDIIDAGHSDFGPYIAMEWLRGESLASVLSSAVRLDVRASVGITVAILSALDAAHNAGIVHRDLKPANVFLVADTDARAVGVKILDFGVAKILDSTVGLTQSGRVLGTAEYLSPEQASGEGSVDARSDLFAVGVLLFQMLTGVSPFHGPNLVATTYRVAHVAPPKLVEVGGPEDPELERVVARALEKHRDARFESARAMAHALIALDGETDYAPSIAQLRLQPDSESVPRERTDSVPSPRWSEPPRPMSGPDRDGAPTLRAAVSSARPLNNPTPVRSVAVLVRGGSGVRSNDLTPQRTSRPPSDRSGHPKIAGRVLRALLQTTRMRFGRDITERARAGAGRGGELRWPSEVVAHSQYDVTYFDAYCESVERLTGVGPDHWRGMGQAAVEAELVTELRPLFRAADAATLAAGALEIWAKLFEFGCWRFEPTGDTTFRFSIEEFDPAGPRLRAWVAGMVEQTFRAAGFSKASVSATTPASSNGELTLGVVLE